MIVCYAQGGGLGHLTRIRAFLHTARPGVDATIVTGSSYAADPRVVGDLPVVSPPPAIDRGRLTGWLRDTLRGLAADELVVDAFPAGLAGELTAEVRPPGVRAVTHLARLLRLDAYRPLLPARPLRFDTTWYVEPLTGAHRAHLADVSGTLAPLRLEEPPVTTEPDPAGRCDGGWLVVHSGPGAEVAELIRYATEMATMEHIRPRLVLVSSTAPAVLPPGVHHLGAYPAWPLFARAARIITAAGCNAVRQAGPWRSRHRMVPFPRRYDDQFTRAARARAGTVET